MNIKIPKYCKCDRCNNSTKAWDITILDNNSIGVGYYCEKCTHSFIIETDVTVSYIEKDMGA